MIVAIAALCMGLAFGHQAMAEADVEVNVNLGAEATVPEGEVTISTFYDTLAPYGKWVQDPTYGWVFVPAEVTADANWQPYCDGGHWTNTEDCGWYWESDYKWGWAAFHYGRWCRHAAHRWIWVPDCTWGPAWVSWRECDTHYGWAALPPGCEFRAGAGFHWHGAGVAVGFEFGLVEADFCFVPCGHFLDHDCWRHRCGGEERHGFYNKTVIKNTYITKNTTIINNGFEKGSVEKRTNTKIVKTRVVEQKLGAGQKISEKHVGNTIHTYRPTVTNKTPVTPPQALKHREAARQKQKVAPEKKAPVEKRAPPKNERRKPREKAAPRTAPAPHEKAAPKSTPAPAPHHERAAPAAPREKAAPKASPVPAPHHEKAAPKPAPAPAPHHEKAAPPVQHHPAAPASPPAAKHRN